MAEGGGALPTACCRSCPTLARPCRTHSENSSRRSRTLPSRPQPPLPHASTGPARRPQQRLRLRLSRATISVPQRLVPPGCKPKANVPLPMPSQLLPQARPKEPPRLKQPPIRQRMLLVVTGATVAAVVVPPQMLPPLTTLTLVKLTTTQEGKKNKRQQRRPRRSRLLR
jgi:hypothetical protein